MLMNMRELLGRAQEEGKAVGAFNVVDSTTVRAVIDAAQTLDRPVILAFAEVHRDLIPLWMIAGLMLDAARRANVPVAVHLDHGTDEAYIREAIDLGFGSVMFDGSALPYEENIRKTADIAAYAHAMGVSVEGELGQMTTGEDGAARPDACYTDPEQAADFVSATGADFLAIAFGTQHGIYAQAPKLSFDIVRRVRGATRVPLVMHGGSGVKTEEFHRAIESGIRKINYFTYMSLAGAQGAASYAQRTRTPQFHLMAEEARIAMQRDVEKAIRTFQLMDA